MPGISGIEACRRIKSDPRFEDIPIVMVTGSTEQHCLQQSFEAGAIDYITKPIKRIELLARLHSISALKAEMDRRKKRELELLRVKEELEQANRELEKLSSLDGLTGVANRRSFDRALAREWDRARRGGQPISVVLLDIDYFKKYNDTYGHQRGDACLIAVARAVSQVTQRSTDLVTRYGGEEFAAILPDLGHEGALHIAHRFNRAVAALRLPHMASQVSQWISVSVGVATIIPGHGESAQVLVGRADQALYHSKACGRDRVTHFADLAWGALDGPVRVAGRA
jgi:two-component system, chemotaxis family, response regulator WspR